VELPKGRIEIFTDAVMAIIMTLLVLDLRAPELAADTPLNEYLQAIAPLGPKFLSFALSFTMVAVFWINHYYFFRHLKHVTGGMLWLNFLMLFWLCLLPFPTQFLGAHPMDQIPITLYALNMLCCSLAFLAMRWHALRAGLFDSEEIARVKGPRYSLPGIYLCLLSLVFVTFNTWLAIACLLLLPALYFLPAAMRSAGTMWAKRVVRRA
jgi:uncharacterized membrane protein